MKKKIITSTILLLSLCISPEFNAATPKQQHDNSTNKFSANIFFQLTQNGLFVPAVTYTIRNTTISARGKLYPVINSWQVLAREGDVIAFYLGGLIGIKYYTVTAEDEESGSVSLDLLNL